ncbi:hypothetical protein C2845_PM01G48080 [Panicum miliaceum]|uniref:DUF4220 domain-containing protein n=1 Tax=Panicum miliaceum TaxID=4540 RepID=A0A3L6TS55_PANMI|nr:hypothetical protein C2845_PM01G48080 [Panicum miliaceum]
MGHVGALFHRFNNVLETRVSAIRIEALSALVAVVMSFLVIFGSWRRWSTHWFIRKGVMAAYILSFTLVTYTIGLMQSAAVKIEVYPIWAVCFLTVFGCTNSISAYSLDDNYHLWPQVYQCILYTIYALLIMFSVADGVTFIAVFPMLIIALVKVYIRIGSSIKATNLWLDSKIATDLMENKEFFAARRCEDGCSEDNEDYFTSRWSEHYDPNTMMADPYDDRNIMKGYPYVILFWANLDSFGGAALNFKPPYYALEATPKNFGVITIEEVWQECSKVHGPLQSSLQACKDIALSFSLYKLLVFRFFGYTSVASTKSKSWDLVFKKLLYHRTETDREYEWVFQVIETELAFLYDCFFTKYSSINSRSTTVWGLASVVSLLCVMALTVVRAAGIFPTGGRNDSSPSNVSVTKATEAENIITVTILVALALLEVLQMVFYWTSNWGRVHFVCKYISQLPASSRMKPSCSMRLIAFLSRIKLFSTRRYYWKQQLGQYCLFQSIGHPNKCLGRFVRIANICGWILGAVGLPHAFIAMPPEVSLGAEHVKVPRVVRQSVVRFLEQTGGHLTNGASSLVSNQASQLQWACSQRFRTSAEDKGSQTRTILTWHIATYYCKMQLTEGQQGADLNDLNVQVAMTLSQYCAYLIIFAAQLLPGHKCDTHCLLRAAAHEAASFLKDKGDRYTAMMSIEPDQQTIFGSGIKLGKQLQDIPCDTWRWKVIADFWSEMMLYLAPSDNIKGHIEQLAEGGEFITHLWALLYHAGIVKREDHHENRTEDPEGHSLEDLASLCV